MYASFFIGVLYLQHVRHYGVLHTGVAFLPQTVTLAALSFGLTARLVNRFGACRRCWSVSPSARVAWGCWPSWGRTPAT